MRLRDLGLNFPLNDGDLEGCDMYAGPGTCALCARDGHLFCFGIGGYTHAPCSSCKSSLLVHVVEGRAACACGGRSAPIARDERGQLRACFACFREGRALLVHDTELGMIDPVISSDGFTHGVPVDPEEATAFRGFRTQEGEDGWLRLFVGHEAVSELLRTPTFSTWQGSVWRFCCQRPMRYVGEWDEARLIEHAGDAQAAESALAVMLGDQDDEGVWEDVVRGSVGGPYVFECTACSTYRASVDRD